MDGNREQHAPEPGAAPEHPGRLAHPRPRRRVLGKLQDRRPDPVAYVTVPTCSPTGLNIDCFLPLQPWPGSPAYSPNPPTGFFDDVERSYKQLAEFASIDVDLIPKTLTLTGGIRHFKYDDSESGGDVGSFYCKWAALRPPPTTYFGPCQAPYGTDVSTRAPNRTTPSGNRARGNLSWHVTDHDPSVLHLVAGLPGGPVQSRNVVPPAGPRQTRSVLRSGLHGAGQRDQQRGRLEDRMVRSPRPIQRRGLSGNLEQRADRVLRPAGRPRQPGFRHERAELPGQRRRTLPHRTRDARLDVQASAAWNSTSQTNSPYLVDNNPASVNYGKPITSIPNPYGPLGSTTPYSPPFKANARVRYEWTLQRLRRLRAGRRRCTRLT